MGIRAELAVTLGHLVSWVSRTFQMGAGATWPGEVALFISPSILCSLANRFTKGIILVVGTNGKTTTASMISSVLKKNGNSLTHNASGANLLNGVVSACVLDRRSSVEYGVFEVDENSLPIVLQYITPRVIVMLNLFRDQLDRYGEVDVIAEKWQKALRKLSANTTLVLNADDPLVASFGKKIRATVTYFGLSEKFRQTRALDHATDSIFCRVCGGRLVYTMYYFSHLGDWQCPVCGDKRPETDLSYWDSPLPGLYNTYNTLAAVLTARVLRVADAVTKIALIGFSPAFGRQEEFTVNGKPVKLFLSKNPAGFNASIRAVLDMSPKIMLLALNDRIPDGRDVSWIWDADFELLPNMVTTIITGDRVYDMGLRIEYSKTTDKKQKISKTIIEPDLKKAVETGLAKLTLSDTLYVLATYSAMLEIRKLLTGRKIL